MRPIERLFVYGAIALLGLVNVLHLAGRPPAAAVATPTPLADELGPADGVVLSGDDEDLVLRNRDGRLGWGDDGPIHRAHSVAFCHIGKVLAQLVDADELVEERTLLRDELQEVEEDYKTRIDEIRRRVEGMDPQSPETQQAMEEGNRLLQEYGQWGTEVQRRQALMQADHFERAYRELVSAVNVVADRQDIDIVLRFIPPDMPFETPNPDAAMTTIRLRTALRYPAALDITPEVMEELSLEDA
ncbi:MAG: OmpH/Skp family outer membrane protein [Planctomycetota bacterium]|jgi:Skp family chaperone for outer membrane proteins